MCIFKLLNHHVCTCWMYAGNSHCLGEYVLRMDVFLSFMQITSEQVYFIQRGTQQMRHPFSNIPIHGDKNSHLPDQSCQMLKQRTLMIRNSLLVTGERILKIAGLLL